MPSPSPGIANEYLPLGMNSGRALTNMHLQKLVYIAHGWKLAIYNEPLTDDDPEAWDYGPVYPELYEALRGYGSDNVVKPIRYSDYMHRVREDGEVRAILSEEERALIRSVWENYGHFHAFQLSALTHVQGSPWSLAYEQGRNTVIGRDEVRNFFLRVARERGQQAAPTFA